MAVTIDEMQVEVQEAPAPAKGAEPKQELKKNTDLNQALELHHERTLRLRAD